MDTKSNIEKISASKINTYYTNDFTKEGTYRIEAKGQSAVVIVAPQDSVKVLVLRKIKRYCIFLFNKEQ